MNRSHKLILLFASVMTAACSPTPNDGLEAFSTDWCRLRIPAGWSTTEATYRSDGRRVKELNIADPTSNVLINIQNISPPFPNPGWNFAHQMLTIFNEIAEQETFSGEEATSVSRHIGSKLIVAYCMTVTVSSPDNPRQIKWETYKLSHSISSTFIIVSYPTEAPDELGTVIDSILKSLRIN